MTGRAIGGLREEQLKKRERFWQFGADDRMALVSIPTYLVSEGQLGRSWKVVCRSLGWQFMWKMLRRHSTGDAAVGAREGFPGKLRRSHRDSEGGGIKCIVKKLGDVTERSKSWMRCGKGGRKGFKLEKKEVGSGKRNERRKINTQ